MKDKGAIHETQPAEQAILYRDEYYTDENLRAIQQIEGGGSIKKADLNSMPRPVRIFGYGFVVVMVLMAAAIVGVSVFR
ncbi:hypothetical protein [Paenibacillus sp. GCM10027626]|uniref:hypothetical protein n=1 Tax=Paenibacillus sp. GCM10027626 TaxID=3273411 RepID=UPI003636EE68